MSVVPQEESMVVSFSEAADMLAPRMSMDPNLAHSRQSSDANLVRSIRRRSINEIGVVPFNNEPRLEIRAVMSRDDHNLNDDENYSNAWHDFRVKHPQVFAEFLGTFILVLWGLGTQAQVIAARKATDDYISISWGWGVVFMLAIYVSSGISGGHINPFLTVSLAVFRKFPWKQVPGYIGAQMSGGFLAAVIYGVYYGPLHAMTDGNYSGIFITGPGALRPSIASNVFNVFVPAALLMAPFRLSLSPETTPRRRVSRLSSWVSSWLESLRALATRQASS